MVNLNSDGKMIFAIFIGAIITVVFLGSIADSVFLQTNTFSVSNNTVTAPAINGTLILEGRELVSGTTPSVVNTTAHEIQDQGVTVTDGLISGVQTVFLSVNDSSVPNNGSSVNVTYEFNPDGYLKSSSDRSVARLVIITGALAILVFVIVVMIKFGSFGKLLRER